MLRGNYTKLNYFPDKPRTEEQYFLRIPINNPKLFSNSARIGNRKRIWSSHRGNTLLPKSYNAIMFRPNRVLCDPVIKMPFRYQYDKSISRFYEYCDQEFF